MDVIGVLKLIPDTVWAAIIASFLTLGGVFLTNRGARKMLLTQLRHESSEQDREREMTLRREVYLAAAESISRIQTSLTRLTNLEVPETILAEEVQLRQLTVTFRPSLTSHLSCVALTTEKHAVKYLPAASVGERNSFGSGSDQAGAPSVNTWFRNSAIISATSVTLKAPLVRYELLRWLGTAIASPQDTRNAICQSVPPQTGLKVQLVPSPKGA